MTLRSGVAIWRHWAGQTLEDRDPQRDRRELMLLCAAAAFVLLNAVAYSLVRDGGLRWSHLYAPVVWLAVVVVAHILLRALRPARDPFLLPIFALLTGWGLLLQDRLAPNFLGRQTLWLALATAALLIVAALPGTLRPLLRYRYVLLLAGLVLLAITLIFGVNPSGSGAALWLPVPLPFSGQVYFQPSELLKLLLVVFLASYFTEQEPIYRYRQAQSQAAHDGTALSLSARAGRFLLRHLPFLGPLLLMWGFTLLLLVWQRDLGAAALFFIVFVALVYLATGDSVYVWSGLLLLLLAGVIAFYAFDTVVAGRVLSWLNPWPDASDRAYQIVQALYAQAAGGVLGQGIGQGFPDYIPVVHSDFALAALAEEWGLVGSLTVVACFAVLAARGLRAAVASIRGPRPNFFHAYLAAGLVTLFSVQAFLIMGGVTRLLPLTGITLPFISYGGSSLLVSSLAVGLLLYLSAAAEPVPPVPPRDAGLARRIVRLATLILLGFALVALVLTYWGVTRSEALLAREDNPRLVEAEQRVQRGRIVDRHETVLAESVGPADDLTRVYPVVAAGPAVGYYSLRFGATGIESAYDATLRGATEQFWPEALRRLLHRPPIGRDVRLTLDAALQETADALLAESGATGGLILLELTEIGGAPVAEVRAMVSRPGYDPNRIDAEFENLTAEEPGPLINRATQGLYQPGLALQPFILAAAAGDGVLQPDEVVTDPFLPVTLNGHVLRCAAARQDAGAATYTWADMLTLGCPAPLYDLGTQMGAAALNDILTRFGFQQAPQLPIPTAWAAASIAVPGLAAIGQENLTVTPLQVALAAAAVAGDGRLPEPRLVEAVAAPGDEWEVQTVEATPTAAAIPSEAAAAARDGWPVAGDARGLVVSVLAGPDGGRDAWYVGLAPADNPRFVVALALEEVADPGVAQTVGHQLLAAATAASR